MAITVLTVFAALRYRHSGTEFRQNSFSRRSGPKGMAATPCLFYKRKVKYTVSQKCPKFDWL